MKFSLVNTYSIKDFVISTEEDLVATARAKKLKIAVLQGINDKVKALSMISTKHGYAFDKI